VGFVLLKNKRSNVSKLNLGVILLRYGFGILFPAEDTQKNNSKETFGLLQNFEKLRGVNLVIRGRILRENIVE
jgi:hypothetical protein